MRPDTHPIFLNALGNLVQGTLCLEHRRLPRLPSCVPPLKHRLVVGLHFVQACDLEADQSATQSRAGNVVQSLDDGVPR